MKLLTDKNARQSNNSNQTDSDDIESNDKFEQRELKESSPPLPTFMYTFNGPNVSPSETLNISPREGPVSCTWEPNLEGCAFVTDYSIGRNCFNLLSVCDIILCIDRTCRKCV